MHGSLTTYLRLVDCLDGEIFPAWMIPPNILEIIDASSTPNGARASGMIKVQVINGLAPRTLFQKALSNARPREVLEVARGSW